MVEPGETKRYRTCDKNGRKVESRHRSRDSDFAECARTCRGRPAGGRGGTSVKNEKKGEQHVITKNVKGHGKGQMCAKSRITRSARGIYLFFTFWYTFLHLFSPLAKENDRGAKPAALPRQVGGRAAKSESRGLCLVFTFLPSLCLHVLYFLFHLVPDLFPCFLFPIFNPFFTLQLHC